LILLRVNEWGVSCSLAERSAGGGIAKSIVYQVVMAWIKPEQAHIIVPMGLAGDVHDGMIRHAPGPPHTIGNR
jgi:hypothetical protein